MSIGKLNQELLRYLAQKRDHAKEHGTALCESFDAWELEDIVFALIEYYKVKDEYSAEPLDEQPP